MSLYWGLTSLVQGGSLRNLNRHYEVLFFEQRKEEVSSQQLAQEEGEISEGEVESEESVASSENEEEVDRKSEVLASTKANVSPHHPLKRPISAVFQKSPKASESEEEEEGAISSSESDLESGEMGSESESDVETKRRRKAVQEVRAEIMARGLPKKSIGNVESSKVGDENRQSHGVPIKRRMDKGELPQMKEAKKPTKQLQCYSEKDVDYRAMWKEQWDAMKAPPNHPFFQISVRNVRTKPYCDLWESEEKKDYLYFKPGTWDHVKDIPRLTEDNLSKLSIAEAKQFVAWLLAERKVANAELLSLRRRFWAESDRHRRLRAYATGQKQLPDAASAVKASQAASNNPTLVTSDGMLIVAPKEQKRLLQGISKLWMTEETSNLLKQKQRVYAKMKKRGTQFFKNKFKELDKLCRVEVKKAKQHWETYMMDCLRQNGIIVGSILEECVERVATGNIPPDPRVLAAQQRRFWQQQRGGRRGGPAWGYRGGRLQRGKSRADQLQL